MTGPIQIVSFYRFSSLSNERIAAFQAWVEPFKASIDLRGLFIIGNEGVNATFSLPPENTGAFKLGLQSFFAVDDVAFKDSFGEKHPFHDLSVKVRNEIVSLSRPDLVPTKKDHHLSPQQWQKVMSEDDVVVIDTRNSYEYDIGHFKGAMNPNTREFNEFPEWLRGSQISKEKKVLIYCTGGIRCEKAILSMNEQGYENVYQLDGGILNYLAEYPRSGFDGECFVFDYRVAVDQDLKPSKNYRLCPHCGQPAKEKITCIQCGVDDIVCSSCLEKSADLKTCSKNCAHHFRMGHRFKKAHQESARARQSD